MPDKSSCRTCSFHLCSRLQVFTICFFFFFSLHEKCNYFTCQYSDNSTLLTAMLCSTLRAVHAFQTWVPICAFYHLQAMWGTVTTLGQCLGMRRDYSDRSLTSITVLVFRCIKGSAWLKGTVQSWEMSFNERFQEAKERIAQGWQQKMLPSLWSNTAESRERKKGTEEVCKRDEWEKQS